MEDSSYLPLFSNSIDEELSKDAAQLASTRQTRARLREAKWYTFDLDDTLHSFRKASGAAVTAVLQAIYEECKPPCSLDDLEVEYKHILRQATAGAFVDGKTSHQYREERFRAVLQKWAIELSQTKLQILLDCYERILIVSLELKPGALDLLKTLRQCGHKVAVVTEGPQDAQERTVAALGLTSYVDFLVTTDKLRVTKVDGLYKKVLEHLSVTPEDTIVLGDSWERDIAPAKNAGICCVHYAENEGSSKELMTMDQYTLQNLVEGAHKNSDLV